MQQVDLEESFGCYVCIICQSTKFDEYFVSDHLDVDRHYFECLNCGWIEYIENDEEEAESS